MSEQPDPGAQEYGDITEKTLLSAAEAAARLNAATSSSEKDEIYDSPDYKAVSEMQAEAGQDNELADLGAERFGLSRQEIATSEGLLDVLYELADVEEEKKYSEAEVNRKIADLQKGLASKHEVLDKEIADAEAKIRELAQKPTAKTE